MSQDPFPFKLFKFLLKFPDSVEWNDDGTGFKILKRELFLTHWKKWNSVTRQFSNYEFTANKREGFYSHPKFLRDDPSKLHEMKSTESQKKKKRRQKMLQSPNKRPNSTPLDNTPWTLHSISNAVTPGIVFQLESVHLHESPPSTTNNMNIRVPAHRHFPNNVSPVPFPDHQSPRNNAHNQFVSPPPPPPPPLFNRTPSANSNGCFSPPSRSHLYLNLPIPPNVPRLEDDTPPVGHPQYPLDTRDLEDTPLNDELLSSQSSDFLSVQKELDFDDAIDWVACLFNEDSSNKEKKDKKKKK